MSPRETCQPHIAGLLASDRQIHKTVRTVVTILQDIWYPRAKIQNMVFTIAIARQEITTQVQKLHNWDSIMWILITLFYITCLFCYKYAK